MLTAVIYGSGEAGKRHAEAYEELGVTVLGYLYGPDCRYGVTGGADIVSIASPDQFHAEQVIAALQAGKHVFCEKPVSHRRFDLWGVKRAAAKAIGKFAVNLPLRYEPKFARLIAEAPRDSYLIEASYNWGRRYKLTEGWRSRCRPYSFMAAGGLHMMSVADELLVLHTWKLQDRRVDGRVDERLWRVGGRMVRITANFGYEGQHEHFMRVWHSEGMIEVCNTDPVSFLPSVKAFIDAIENDTETNGARALYLNGLCI